MGISKIGTAATITVVVAWIVYTEAGAAPAAMVGILLAVFWVYLFRTLRLRETVERNRTLLRTSFTKL